MSFKISVVIVLYNAEKTIRATLDSLSSQIFRNYEVIVVDGKSTDSTMTIVDTYCNRFPQLRVYSEKDKGIYDAMNKGIKLAIGDYLYFLNAGDVLFSSDVFQTVADYFDGKSVYYGDAYTKDASGELQNFLTGRFSKYRLAESNICHQSIFYPNKYISKEMYNLDYRIYADYVMNMSLWRKVRFVYVNTPIIVYEGGGISDIEIDYTFRQNKKRLIGDYLGIEAWMYIAFLKILRMLKLKL